MNQVLIGSITTLVGLIAGSAIEYVRSRLSAAGTRKEERLRSLRAMIERELNIGWDLAHNLDLPISQEIREAPIKARARTRDLRLFDLLKRHAEVMQELHDARLDRLAFGDDHAGPKLEAARARLLDVQTDIFYRMEKLQLPD